MSNYTDYLYMPTGGNYYAKAEPLNTGTWSTGVVAYTENGSTGSYAATLDSATPYAVYQQAGASPASSDTLVAFVAVNYAYDIKTQTDLIRESGIVQVEQTTNTIKLYVGSTKAKTQEADGDLTGKTLKLYVHYPKAVYFAEYTATGANGFFSFTPDATLTADCRSFYATLREPSDGNNVLWDGLIEVSYAADAE